MTARGRGRRWWARWPGTRRAGARFATGGRRRVHRAAAARAAADTRTPGDGRGAARPGPAAPERAGTPPGVPAGRGTPSRTAGRRAGRAAARSLVTALAAATVLTQVAYPLVHGRARDALTVLAVLLFFAASAGHAASSRGVRPAAALVALACGGGLAVEAVGTRTGLPFGDYHYTGGLGPALCGVPLVIPLAWAMMAWPAHVVAARLTVSRPARVATAGVALASWDLFLDPQMVDAGHWRWTQPDPALPGVPGVPLTNYLGWVVVAVALAAALDRFVAGAPPRPGASDAVPVGLYLWTYASSVLAHAAFFGLPGSALWGGLGMGLVAVPLARSLRRVRAAA